jgi:hypothetical protein
MRATLPSGPVEHAGRDEPEKEAHVHQDCADRDVVDGPSEEAQVEDFVYDNKFPEHELLYSAAPDFVNKIF